MADTAAMRRPHLAPLLALLLVSMTFAVGCAPKPVVDARPATVVVPTTIKTSFYAGEIMMPGAPAGSPDNVAFFIRVEPSPQDASTAAAYITIPSQGLDSVPLKVNAHNAKGSDLQLEVVGARIVWARAARDIDCRFQQGDATLSCSLELLDAQSFASRRLPPRPQHPRPPFAYSSVELEWSRPASPGRPETAAKFSGTLTLPEGAGPHPALLLISGAGPHDRDETIMWHKPFWVIADVLSNRGIAVLRVDDRGVGESTGAGGLAEIDSLDLADDARTALAQLRARPEIDPTRVGIVGHSQGALVASIVAAKDLQLAFLVLLAGPGMTGAELLIAQQRAVGRASGESPEQLAMAEGLYRSAYAVVIAQGADANFDAVVDGWIRGLPELDRPDRSERVRLVEQLRSQASSRWFRSFVSLDPGAYLAKIRCPVLALAGSKDLQVVQPANLDAVTKALARGGNARVEAHSFAGLNHLFQAAGSGLPVEYGQLETTIEGVVLERISKFVRARTGLERSGGPVR